MKRIHLNIFAGLLSMLLLTSCAKELEKTPLDAISSETYIRPPRHDRIVTGEFRTEILPHPSAKQKNLYTSGSNEV